MSEKINIDNPGYDKVKVEAALDKIFKDIETQLYQSGDRVEVGDNIYEVVSCWGSSLSLKWVGLKEKENV